MAERGTLLISLERLFAGPSESILTLEEFLRGLQGRSYAFAIAALDLPNVIPTGIPWLSTITGLPMLLLLMQFFMGREVPSLPGGVGRRGLPRRHLQACLDRCGPYIRRLETTVRPRSDWLVSGLPRRLMILIWAANIFLLALPIPFANLLPAWAILCFCLAQIEGDGVMAALGWVLSALTAIWTVFLLLIGHAAVMAIFSAVKAPLFGD